MVAKSNIKNIMPTNTHEPRSSVFKLCLSTIPSIISLSVLITIQLIFHEPIELSSKIYSIAYGF